MGRYKALIGPRLRARGFAAQQTEAAIGVAALNRMLAAGRPTLSAVKQSLRRKFGSGLFRLPSVECTNASPIRRRRVNTLRRQLGQTVENQPPPIGRHRHVDPSADGERILTDRPWGIGSAAVALKVGRLLGELDTYACSQSDIIVDFATPDDVEEPLLTAVIESAVRWLLYRRMNAQQQMSWTPRGAHLMLKVRCAVMLIAARTKGAARWQCSMA
jgi:hypothetical protein